MIIYQSPKNNIYNPGHVLINLKTDNFLAEWVNVKTFITTDVRHTGVTLHITSNTTLYQTARYKVTCFVKHCVSWKCNGCGLWLNMPLITALYLFWVSLPRPHPCWHSGAKLGNHNEDPSLSRPSGPQPGWLGPQQADNTHSSGIVINLAANTLITVKAV